MFFSDTGFGHISVLPNINPQPQISVTGSAEVKVAPDEIRVNVTVENQK